MGQTIVEKIFSAHAGRSVQRHDIVIAPVDCLVGLDNKTPRALQIFQDELGGELGIDPEKVVFVLDHYVPCSTVVWANGHKKIRNFARENNITLFEQGSGICHTIIPEQGFALPGDILGFADGQASTSGAVNCISITISATEIAAVLRTGELWFKVPETIRVNLKGKPQKGVYAKDIILRIIQEIGADNANYQVIEFGGEGLAELSMDARFTLCNMTIHLGAKSAVIEPDETLKQWVGMRAKRPFTLTYPDADAEYAALLDVDMSAITPMVVLPHHIDTTVDVSLTENVPVDQVFIGTCTNGRLEDLRIAADIVRGKKIHPGVRMVVAASSREVHQKALDEGIIDDLFKAGANILIPSCGSCTGSNRNFVPGDGEVILSTACKNHVGRIMNKTAAIYLSSPATAAISALTGVITDPRKLGKQGKTGQR